MAALIAHLGSHLPCNSRLQLRTPSLPRLCIAHQQRSRKLNCSPGRSPFKVCASAGGDASGSASTAASSIAQQLRELETERAEAISTAETCGRTHLKLEDMSEVLQKLALERVRTGDEDAARQLLKVRCSAMSSCLSLEK